MALKLPFIGGRKTVKPTKTLGHTGTSVYGGYLTTNEDNAALVGTARYTTYSDILANTSIVAAGTRYFLNLVSKAGWHVDPAHEEGEEPSDKAKEIAEAVETAMHDMETPWHRVVRRAAMYRFYGFSVQEWTAKEDKENGVINYLDIAPRPQVTIEQWDVDASGKVEGMIQQSPQTFNKIYLPRRKVIYVVDDSLSDNPEGLGLFRHIVESSRRLRRFEQLEGYGFENDLRGIPVGRAPFTLLQELVDQGKLSPSQKASIEKPLQDFIQSHIKSPALGLLLDSMVYTSEDDAASPSNVKQWDMELLKAGNTSQDAVARSIERLNREIARTLGVEQLLLGDGSTGSYALSRDKTQAFATIVDSSLQELAQTFDKDFIEPLFLLNGWDETLKPTIRTKSINLRDILQVTQALKDMASAGNTMAADDPAIIEVRDLLGLSRPEKIVIDEEEPLMEEQEEQERELPPAEGGRAKEQPEGTHQLEEERKR